MKIDLTQLDQGSLSFQRDLKLDTEDLDNPLVVSVLQVHVEGTVRPLNEGYLVEGWFSCSTELQCGRCLEPVQWQAREDFSFEYRQMEEIASQAEVDLDEEDLSVAFLEEQQIELQALAIEQIELALPMRVVCDEQCAGLCPSCGGNRNRQGECRCEAETDPRWEVLRSLKDSSA